MIVKGPCWIEIGTKLLFFSEQEQAIIRINRIANYSKYFLNF